MAVRSSYEIAQVLYSLEYSTVQWSSCSREAPAHLARMRGFADVVHLATASMKMLRTLPPILTVMLTAGECGWMSAAMGMME